MGVQVRVRVGVLGSELCIQLIWKSLRMLSGVFFSFFELCGQLTWKGILCIF